MLLFYEGWLHNNFHPSVLMNKNICTQILELVCSLLPQMLPCPILLRSLVSPYPARVFSEHGRMFSSGSTSWAGSGTCGHCVNSECYKLNSLWLPWKRSECGCFEFMIWKWCHCNYAACVAGTWSVSVLKNYLRTPLSILNSSFTALPSVLPSISSCLPQEQGWEFKVPDGKVGRRVQSGEVNTHIFSYR